MIRAGAESATASSGCRFCAIARGEAAARIVYADPFSLAFLDHRPVFPGHVLLIPMVHCQALPDLPAGLTDRLFRSARLLCTGVEAAMAAEGTFVAINNRVSQSVPHLHVHIIPRRRHDGLRGFLWPRQKYSGEEEMEMVAEAIRAATSELLVELLDAPEG
jgi:histidine triad (HIT) family protein